MKSSLLLLLFPVILFTACNKEVTSNPVSEQLSNKNWKVTQIGIDANNNLRPDDNEITSVDPSVNISGIMRNNGSGSNGSGTITFSTPDTSGIVVFTWSLDESNTYISSITPSSSKVTVSKIVSLSDNQLSIIMDTSAPVKSFVFLEKQ